VPEASEAPIPDQRVRPDERAPIIRAPDPDTTGPALAAGGNAAIARMLQRSPSGAGAINDLPRLAGNAQVARFVVQRDADVDAPPAPGGVGAPPAPGATVGAHGEEIRDAQLKLSRVQASAQPLTEDGRYGPLTEAAVRTFQASVGITPPTGVLDAATKARLDAAYAALPPPVRTELKFGATGPDVGFAQQKLNAVGYKPRLVINAVFDGSMLMAVMMYGSS